MLANISFFFAQNCSWAKNPQRTVDICCHAPLSHAHTHRTRPQAWCTPLTLAVSLTSDGETWKCAWGRGMQTKCKVLTAIEPSMEHAARSMEYSVCGTRVSISHGLGLWYAAMPQTAAVGGRLFLSSLSLSFSLALCKFCANWFVVITVARDEED